MKGFCEIYQKEVNKDKCIECSYFVSYEKNIATKKEKFNIFKFIIKHCTIKTSKPKKFLGAESAEVQKIIKDN